MAEAALALSCPVCLDMPRNPVTIPCGHSYCMSCITDCWDHEDPKGIYRCPQCRQTFSPRPALRKNTMLADLAEKLRNMEHREHDVVSPATERQAKQIEIEEMQSNSKERVQRRESELTELTTSVGTIRLSAQEAVDDMEKVCTELTDCIKADCNEIIHLIRGQEEAAVSRAEEAQEQLQLEISELQQKDANIQMLLSSEDDFLFLQSIRSLSNPLRCENSPRIMLSRRGLFEQVRKSISDRKDKITDLLKENRVLLSKEVRKVQIFQPLHPKTREDFLQYACKLTLDLKTAHNNLHFSEANSKLRWGAVQSNPDHPERFDSWWQVLNEEGLTGCWYWEVEYNGTVIIAVSYKSIATKGPGIQCGFGHNDQSWCLCCTSSHYTFWHGNTETKPLKIPSSSRVGVYVDHSAGTLSFYNISDSMSLIHRVKTSFTQPLYPGFGFRLGFFGSIQISPIV